MAALPGSCRCRSCPILRCTQAADPISLWQRTEQASGRTGLDPPFWAFAWAAGQALARYLLDNPDVTLGRHVIDIASGSGLVAIAAAKAGAAAVTAYDIDPLAAAAIGVNAAANGVTVRPSAPTSWTATPPAARTDLVLIADAFYQRDLAARVMRFAGRGRARGAAVLAADFGRAYLPRDGLTPLASLRRPRPARDSRTADVKHTTIWALRPCTRRVSRGSSWPSPSRRGREQRHRRGGRARRCRPGRS